MTDYEFEAALKNFPCPECRETGHLVTKHLVLRIEHLGTELEVAGEGWICEGGCNATFMSDTLTEEVANKVSKIEDSNSSTYFQVDRHTGFFLEHSIH